MKFPISLSRSKRKPCGRRAQQRWISMGIPEKKWGKKWKIPEKIPKNTQIGDFIEEKGEMDIKKVKIEPSKFWSGFDHSCSQMLK